MTSPAERHERARALMKKFPPLPSLSNSAAQLLSAMSARRVTTTTLAQIIERDVALTANVHKVANSPFYGQSRSIATIERALVLLGVDVIRNIALASSVSRVFRGGRLTPAFHIGTLWRHSLAVATLTEAMAKKLAVDQQENAFIAGLLHDVGFLVELTLWPVEFVALVRELEEQSIASRDLLQIEVDRFGASHDDFGRVLLDQWLLPSHLCDAAAAHHRMNSDTGDRTLAALVLLADQLSATIGAPLLTDATSDASRYAALAVLGIDWATLEGMATNLRPQIDSLSGYLDA
jgi:putative nucleotidyltransferase with HDIG domain